MENRYPFPNTYYAKVSSQPLDNLKTGFIYLFQYFIHYNPMAMWMYTLSLGWMYQAWQKKRLEAASAPLFIWISVSLLNLLFPLLTGGDHFYLGRILLPLMPLTTVIFTFLFFKLTDVKLDAIPTRIIQGALGVLLLFTAMLLPDQFRFYRYPMAKSPFHYEFYLTEKGRAMGIQMNTFFRFEKNKPVWGVLCAGGIAYTYEGTTLDLLGLNNVAMAHVNPVKPTDRPKNHGSFDKGVFYKQQPDIMFPTEFVEDSSFVKGRFEQSDTYQTDFLVLAVDHIHQDAHFKSLYVPVQLTSKSDGAVLYSYFRRAYLEQLDTALYEVRYLWGTK